RFTSSGVWAVTLGFCTERTNHLGVTYVATFTDVDVTTFQLQSSVRFQAFNRLVGVVVPEQWNNFRHAAPAQCDDNHHHHQRQAFLSLVVLNHLSVLLKPVLRLRCQLLPWPREQS